MAVQADYALPVTTVLDIDPWSDQILAEEEVWLGWSPLFYGQPTWQSNRFLYDLKTKKRTDLTLFSGVYNLPDGFFLQSDPLRAHRAGDFPR